MTTINYTIDQYIPKGGSIAINLPAGMSAAEIIGGSTGVSISSIGGNVLISSGLLISSDGGTRSSTVTLTNNTGTVIQPLGPVLITMSGVELNAGTIATLGKDNFGNTTGVSISGYINSLGTHVSAALLGDSITFQHVNAGVNVFGAAPQGGWNVGNQLIGSPFVFQNYGLGGDVVNSIFSRIHMIPSSCQVVFIMAGTNDILNWGGAAGAATTTEANRIISVIQTAVNKMVTIGKQVVIATVPPNSTWNAAATAKIQLLDAVNVGIKAMASASVSVVDVFSVVWDSTQPTARLYKPNYTTDGTHMTNLSGYQWGKLAAPVMRYVFSNAFKTVDLYREFAPVYGLYSQYRSSTGGTAGANGFTGSPALIADGWQSYQSAGTGGNITTATALDNSGAYVPDTTNMVGEWVQSVTGFDERWQSQNVIAIGAATYRLQNVLTINAANQSALGSGILAGDMIFFECEAQVSSPVNLAAVQASITAYFTQGTSPADQAFLNTAYINSSCPSISGLTQYPMEEGYRVVLRTGVIRVPENFNMSTLTNLSLSFGADISFLGAGSALVKLARPRCWRSFSPQTF